LAYASHPQIQSSINAFIRFRVHLCPSVVKISLIAIALHQS
jgi:hypothetical protein